MLFLKAVICKEGRKLKRCAMLFLLVALNLTDAAATVYGLSLGCSELNPLFPGKSFIATESLIIKICLPLAYMSLIAVTCRLCVKSKIAKGLKIIDTNFILMAGIYAAVSANNMLAILGRM